MPGLRTQLDPSFWRFGTPLHRTFTSTASVISSVLIFLGLLGVTFWTLLTKVGGDYLSLAAHPYSSVAKII